jgi:hypothetical protein
MITLYILGPKQSGKTTKLAEMVNRLGPAFVLPTALGSFSMSNYRGQKLLVCDEPSWTDAGFRSAFIDSASRVLVCHAKNQPTQEWDVPTYLILTGERA